MLTIQQPADGAIQISIQLGNGYSGGALAATPLPFGVVVAQPTDGKLTILGAVVMGSVVAGSFVQQLPS